jgi:hypothetical protein
VETSNGTAGAFVGIGSAFKKCPAPGKKKSMGETLAPVLMPLQPAPNKTNAANMADNIKFRFNFTLFSIN